MSRRDPYINPAKQRPPRDLDAEGAAPTPLSRDQLELAYIALDSLDWRTGLNRVQIVRKCPDLPPELYMRLPESKRFWSPSEVLREAGSAASRAEGDFLGANPDIPAEESIADGGPPGWGRQPGVYPQRAILDGGSAEDTAGLLPDDETHAE